MLFRSRDEVATAHLKFGRLHEAAGRVEPAKASYLRAIETLEETRAALSGSDNRLTFFARRLAPYEALINLLLRGAQGAQGASGVGKLGAAAAIIEAFKLSERARARGLTDFLVRQGTAPVQPDPVQSVVKSLDEGAMLLQYFIGAEQSHVFVLERGKAPRAVALDARRDVVTAAVQRFRRPFEEVKIKARTSGAAASAYLASAASFDMGAARELYEQIGRAHV